MVNFLYYCFSIILNIIFIAWSPIDTDPIHLTPAHERGTNSNDYKKILSLIIDCI